MDVLRVLGDRRHAHLMMAQDMLPGGLRQVPRDEREFARNLVEETRSHAERQDEDVGVGDRVRESGAGSRAVGLRDAGGHGIHCAAGDPIKQIPIGVGVVYLLADGLVVHAASRLQESARDVSGETGAECGEGAVRADEPIVRTAAQDVGLDHLAGILESLDAAGPRTGCARRCRPGRSAAQDRQEIPGFQQLWIELQCAAQGLLRFGQSPLVE